MKNIIKAEFKFNLSDLYLRKTDENIYIQKIIISVKKNLLILFILTFVIHFLSQRISAAILSPSRMILPAMFGSKPYLPRTKPSMPSRSSISRSKPNLVSKSSGCGLTTGVSIVVSPSNLSWIAKLSFGSLSLHIIPTRMMLQNTKIRS